MLLTEARFIKPAELEFAEAVDYYDAERPALGRELSDCVEAAILQTMHFPDAGTQVIHPRIRDGIVRRFRVPEPFPYDLAATVIESELLILAVSHHKRRPTYWIRRMAGLR